MHATQQCYIESNGPNQYQTEGSVEAASQSMYPNQPAAKESVGDPPDAIHPAQPSPLPTIADGFTPADGKFPQTLLQDVQ